MPADEIVNLADLCVLESNGQASALFQPPTLGSLAQLPSGHSLRIERVGNIQGVNALHAKAALEAGKTSLLVVYGENGAGKSGFARLLKHVCGDRSKDPLLSDVFQECPTLPRADLTTSHKNTTNHKDSTTTETWTQATGPLPSLRYTHVFDSHTAASYLRDRSAAAYQPRRMMLLSDLIAVCDLVAGELAMRKKAHPKTLPELPSELADTPAAKLVKNLKPSTSPSDIDSACQLTDEMKTERLSLEVLLANKDAKKRQQEITGALAGLARAAKEMAVLEQGLSDQALGAVVAARADARIARTAATDGARNAFSDAPLAGVGSDTWMELWRLARAYSETEAYRGKPFPVVNAGSRCVLCQQSLDTSAGVRLSRFEEFVRGGLEAASLQKELALEGLLRALPSIPRREDWQLRAATLGLSESAAEALQLQAEARHEFFLSAETLDGAPQLDWTPLTSSASTVQQLLQTETKLLEDSQDPKKRAEMAGRLNQLRGAEWLSSQAHALKSEVARLGQLADLSKAETLARTNALTTKQNELAVQEIEAGYRMRFGVELAALGGLHLPVELKGFQEGKGRVSFQLGLKGSAKAIAPQLVLSEGEARIVALSAFLADITGPAGSAPFIFDDPVSSLDHLYEERVASRLLELAKSRQVIVFTHRLAFATLLLETAERAKKTAGSAGQPWTHTIAIATVRRLGRHIGLPGGLSVRDSRPLGAMNKLKNENLVRLRKLSDDGDVSAYEEAHSAYCADYRVVLESAVEVILLGGIVGRFRRDIQTKGKIGHLATISAEDCALFDELMTAYSAQDHSQPDELPAALVPLEVLEADAARLIDWLEAHPKP